MRKTALHSTLPFGLDFEPLADLASLCPYPEHSSAPNQLPRFKGHPAPPIPKASFSAGSPIAAAPSSPSRSAFANTSSFAPPAPQQQQQAWDVTPSEKQAADRFFDQLDKFGRGVIEGDVAVPFMLESKLPEVVLASVWCVLFFFYLCARQVANGLVMKGWGVGGALASSRDPRHGPADPPPTLLPPLFSPLVGRRPPLGT